MPFGEYRIFDQMLEGVQIVDPNGRYIYVNDAVVKQSKFSREELLTSTMTELYPGIENTEIFARIRDCYFNRKPQELLNEFDFPDGSKGYFQLRLEPTLEGVLIMSFDRTEQIRAKKLIESNAAYLEEIVRTRTSELIQQNLIIEEQLEELRALNATKDKFFNIIAHDLIGPLNTLKGLATLISDGIAATGNSELTMITSKLHDSVEKTLQLANNLMMWARLQMTERKTSTEEIDITSILHEAIGLYQELANRKNIQIGLDNPNPLLRAFGDKNQISFVLRNLVNNAIKYTHKNGSVQITLSDGGKGFVRISISDNGIGIPDAIRDKITKVHGVKSRDGTDGEKGTGMGLVLSQEFIALNGGRLEITSGNGPGTTFDVYLKSEG